MEQIDARDILARLEQACESEEDIARFVEEFLMDDLERYAPIAIQVAVEGKGYMGRILARVLRTHVDPLLALKLEGQIPAQTLVLREVAVELGRQLLNVGSHSKKDEAGEGDEKIPAESRAKVLNNLAVRFSDIGEFDEAVSNAKGAFGIYSELADKQPHKFLPALAICSSNLAVLLMRRHQKREALEYVERAFRIYDLLVREGLKEYSLDLAISTKSLSDQLAEVGLTDKALSAARRAVQMLESLVNEDEEKCLPAYAASLNSLSNSLSELGRGDEALCFSEKAVQIYRRLVAEHEDAFLPDLATALNNFAVRLGESGQTEEASRRREEAARMY